MNNTEILISNLLKDARIKQRLTVARLAEILNVKASNVYHYESGYNIPPLSVLAIYVHALNIDPVEIFKGITIDEPVRDKFKEVKDYLNSSYHNRKDLKSLKAPGLKDLKTMAENFKGENEPQFNRWIMGAGTEYRQSKQSNLAMCLYCSYLSDITRSSNGV